MADGTDSKCPVPHGRARTNRDWWPNQANVGVLHQNPPASDPMGPAFNDDAPDEAAEERDVGTGGAASQEQDEKRRLGNYQTTGEHAIQQPGGKQGPDR